MKRVPWPLFELHKPKGSGQLIGNKSAAAPSRKNIELVGEVEDGRKQGSEASEKIEEMKALLGK
jgi:hypothetical protein